ncbi:MAG: cytochrome b/b6 domain-containing protein [Paracoccaceae bacterium]|nr:cytochrome b/b6 domain-containing protein [Paracoccaceae bacterium]
MSLTNTPTRYGTVSKTFHWLTALLILTLIPTGTIANGMPFDTSEEVAAKARLFSIHKTLGVTLFTVALLRILWALTQPKPAPLHPDRRVESFMAETAHWLLYGSLLLVPLSGWIHHAATTGFAPILWPFGQDLPFVPKSEPLAETAASLHIIFERVLVIALFLHIAGALKHQFVDRDVTLKRMWFGSAEGGEATARHAMFVPFGAAVASWAAAIAVGASLGLFAHEDTGATEVALTEVSSDWQVQEGTLAIKVTQLGSEVAGSFADWTAAISFDETATGKMGDVEVTISIPSLTLGSVTAQAMGPDFFNAESFPTAEFVADIARDGEVYVATGTLTIRDQTVPVTMPFDLALNGDRAEMTGALTLDRRDFGIGAGMTDESSLGFAVVVDVALVATRGGGN